MVAVALESAVLVRRFLAEFRRTKDRTIGDVELLDPVKLFAGVRRSPSFDSAEAVDDGDPGSASVGLVK